MKAAKTSKSGLKRQTPLEVAEEVTEILMKSGAVRSTDAQGTRFDLICPTGLERLAQTYAEGAQKYAVDNWTKGMPISETLNHVIRHVNLFKQGDASEDHLAHAIWGLFAVIHFSTRCSCHEVRSNFSQLDEAYLDEQK